jgi:hypothetical protein
MILIPLCTEKCTVCPQSQLWVLKNCGAQTNLARSFLFLTPTDGISFHLYFSQSVVCEMATVQERALCGMAF